MKYVPPNIVFFRTDSLVSNIFVHYVLIKAINMFASALSLDPQFDNIARMLLLPETHKNFSLLDKVKKMKCYNHAIFLRKPSMSSHQLLEKTNKEIILTPSISSGSIF